MSAEDGITLSELARRLTQHEHWSEQTLNEVNRRMDHFLRTDMYNMDRGHLVGRLDGIDARQATMDAKMEAGFAAIEDKVDAGFKGLDDRQRSGRNLVWASLVFPIVSFVIGAILVSLLVGAR